MKKLGDGGRVGITAKLGRKCKSGVIRFKINPPSLFTSLRQNAPWLGHQVGNIAASLGPQSCLCALSLSSLLGRKVDSTLCKLQIAVPVVPPTGGGDFQQVLIAAPTSAGGCLCCDAPMLRRKGRRKGVAVKEFTGC
ncbi:hypothetical protein CDAR_59111 [Caerostris darwini]|uniref:Uncharacterized protein n=1 Tax=Caerostris darwini TaxID=1538125 RepID=A0AAV4X3J1_9ARAC|nr:hypothetical protein CDAR_59111 [Caerostris darwini]